jgi:hypothetical protein
MIAVGAQANPGRSTRAPHARVPTLTPPPDRELASIVSNPDVTFGGIPMRATVVGDETERNRIWGLADRVFAPYATYRREAAQAHRTIPIVQLIPR